MKRAVDTNKSQFVCINCGCATDRLYREFKGGIIKITHCHECGKVADKYIEYDLVIVSLDALLLKRQAFRHIMMNTGIKAHWKFCLVLLICEAFIKLLQQNSVSGDSKWLPDHVIYSALEIDLYWSFFLAVVELFSFLFGVLLWIFVWKTYIQKETSWPSLRECACGIMLSNFGKVLVLPAMLWGQRYSAIYVRLSELFTVAANIQATRVLCPKWNIVLLTAAILFGHFLSYCAKLTFPLNFATFTGLFS